MNPWGEIRNRDIEVRYAELDGRLGECDPQARVITLDSRLDQIERRTTLMHELIHLERGDTCLIGTYPDGTRQDLIQERNVHREAARRLIGIRDLSYAFATWGDGDLAMVADQCWVDESTLIARLDGLHPTERGLIRGALDAREDAA